MNLKVPATTTPLTKFIRTGEGILVYAANLALILIPILTSSLSATSAVKYGVILDAVAVAARSVVKALNKPAQVTLGTYATGGIVRPSPTGTVSTPPTA